MATQPGILYNWPWEKLGQFKYLLYTPFVAVAARSKLLGVAGADPDDWCFHMMAITLLRYLHAQLWVSASRYQPLVQKHVLGRKGINFEQVDREDGWDDFIILQVYVATAVRAILPGFHSFPLWDGPGLLILLLLHASLAEWVYYWAHRALHHHYLYVRYHSHHHASFITEPITGSVHPFAEHILYTAIFAIPMLGTWVLGGASVAMFYAYLIGFDFLNSVGHCNFEFMPHWLFEAVPGLKYLIYTPSFHSLHHSHVHTNFCLFMPLYDYLGQTWDRDSDSTFETASKGQKDPVDFVFLAHGTTLLSMFHLPFGLRSFAARPFAERGLILALWPLTLPLLLLLWLFGKAFTADGRRLRGHHLQTWVVPRLGFQYFLRSEKKLINNLIQDAIVRANDSGVKVFTLGALNKNEALNGGGTLFVETLGDSLRVRVVHGNTLTAAVIIQEVPRDVTQVMLTGATSKLGRAIALYLCRRGVRVLMLTSSEPRFTAIQNEAAPQHRHLLERVTDAAQGADCKHWIIGKWLSRREQLGAPSGTYFHQFVVPTMPEVRKDCTYGKLAAMHLPEDIQGLRVCEMTMERGVVHACHAGGLVHLLEGWQHHEVGKIDVDMIDTTWKAALKHGLKPV